MKASIKAPKIDTKEFQKISKEMESFDKKREELIKASRDILKLSKEIIYAIHREDLKSAEAALNIAKTRMDAFVNEAKKQPKLQYSGTFKITVQEFIEAEAFFELIKNGTLPNYTDSKFDAEHYLLGICDLTGEIVRKAINAAIKEDYAKTLQLKEFVSELYSEFMKFDFPNGELRKKYDGMKYDLKKLEDLVLELKLKGKL